MAAEENGGGKKRRPRRQYVWRVIYKHPDEPLATADFLGVAPNADVARKRSRPLVLDWATTDNLESKAHARRWYVSTVESLGLVEYGGGRG